MTSNHNIPRSVSDASGGEESGQGKKSLPTYPDNFFDDERFRDGEEHCGLWPDEDEDGYPEEEDER